MERAARFIHEDSTETKLDKLDALLARTLTPRHAALFADLLSLPNDGRYANRSNTTAETAKDVGSAHRQFVALSPTSPVLMIVEDIHWIDPQPWKRSVEGSTG